MENVTIKLQVASTGKYTLDEFVEKVKNYANKLASSISSTKDNQEVYMSPKEQEAYVAESLNRALDQMESHRKNHTKPKLAKDLLKELRGEA